MSKELVFALREAAPDIEKEYCSPYGQLVDTAADLIEQQASVIEQMREALEELKDLMEDVYQGNYHPDSFTTQPARNALALQPSPEILEARDKRVAEACAKLVETDVTHANDMADLIRSGEWRKHL